MPDLSTEILEKIKLNRLENLNLPEGLITPDHGETSILGLPASLAFLLGAPQFEAPTLAPEILAPISGGVKRIVWILVDALAFGRLQRWLSEDDSLLWNQLLREGIFLPITSVIPSTTSTCLPTMWSGQPPAAHGFVGYELWLKEYGVVANMIKHSPFNIDNPAGSLEKSGFDPSTALPGQNLGTHLNNSGVSVHTFQHMSIFRSGLSKLFLKNVTPHSFTSTTNLWFNLRDTVNQQDDQPALYWIYWGEVDAISHIYGPDSERNQAAFGSFTQGFRDIFLDGLAADRRDGTLIVLTADHGQITTPKDPFYDLKSHPGLERRLHIKPTGENRLIYFHIRPGQTEAVREYIERTFVNQFHLIDPDTAIRGGLFGLGNPHPRLRDRIGDLIAISRGNTYLWWSRIDNPLIGRHGGLSEDEMLVPFLGARL